MPFGQDPLRRQRPTPSGSAPTNPFYGGGWGQYAQQWSASHANSGSGSSGAGGSGSSDQSAYQLLASTFARLGMSVGPDLQKIIHEMMTGGYGPGDIQMFMPEIEQTSDFKTRFPGFQQRIQNGYSALSLGDYINLEDEYHRILQQNGMPSGFYDNHSDFANWIANDVSPDEIQTRVTDAVSLAQQVDPSMRNIMAKYYGLSTGDIASYFLDQKRALPTIQRQYDAAGVAAAAQQAGLNVDGMSRYEGLVDKGVTAQQAQSAYGTIRSLTDTVGDIAKVYGQTYNQTDAENDVFFNDSQKRNKLVANERATFGGVGKAAGTGSNTRGAY